MTKKCVQMSVLIEEGVLTINTPSAGGVLTNNNHVRRLEIDGIIPSPRNYFSNIGFRYGV